MTATTPSRESGNALLHSGQCVEAYSVYQLALQQLGVVLEAPSLRQNDPGIPTSLPSRLCALGRHCYESAVASGVEVGADNIDKERSLLLLNAAQAALSSSFACRETTERVVWLLRAATACCALMGRDHLFHRLSRAQRRKLHWRCCTAFSECADFADPLPSIEERKRTDSPRLLPPHHVYRLRVRALFQARCAWFDLMDEKKQTGGAQFVANEDFDTISARIRNLRHLLGCSAQRGDAAFFLHESLEPVAEQDFSWYHSHYPAGAMDKSSLSTPVFRRLHGIGMWCVANIEEGTVLLNEGAAIHVDLTGQGTHATYETRFTAALERFMTLMRQHRQQHDRETNAEACCAAATIISRCLALHGFGDETLNDDGAASSQLGGVGRENEEATLERFCAVWHANAIRPNNIDFCVSQHQEDAAKGGSERAAALFINLSRVNHSCRPSCLQYFLSTPTSDSRPTSHASLTPPRVCLVSLCHLGRGEEVSISYCPVFGPARQRAQHLRFDCECGWPNCVATGSKSEPEGVRAEPLMPRVTDGVASLRHELSRWAKRVEPMMGDALQEVVAPPSDEGDLFNVIAACAASLNGHTEVPSTAAMALTRMIDHFVRHAVEVWGVPPAWPPITGLLVHGAVLAAVAGRGKEDSLLAVAPSPNDFLQSAAAGHEVLKAVFAMKSPQSRLQNDGGASETFRMRFRAELSWLEEALRRD